MKCGCGQEFELVGITEIAEALGVTKGAVCVWAKRHPETFPRPLAELHRGPVYDLHAIRRWLEEREAPKRGLDLARVFGRKE